MDISSKIAQLSTPLGNLRGIGPLGFENGDPSQGPGLFNRIISTTIGVMTMAAAIFLLFQIILAAYSWMNAGGDKAAIEDARKKIINAIIGLTIVIAAIFLLDLVGTLIGFPYITNPEEFITNITR
ncbi:hypothetical protein A2686_03340 [Candidatus Woesebacteria bacterium RIFCSPHIGHO2_01_FULL_38_10]|uniref:Uncharacterized protein n=1 Tax=Candidatus Woesebacteria bacterium RIFCSPLOWO2_01_FULL_39_10b TaxID=1802517 RepID=A0A1F8B9K8_9BACT|nr:MAG: hypothetical protein A2686_03340 [Candidatus Woesebacteria bacterium RIFCSPHIGHO2_01_FULL_38_10]OGM60359.1 MAG: hypothetical protein A2892_03410 [Candidatus Woesebacteria bacterium RIFCSPLOWO2_01_FULL_39_10b]